MKTFIDQINIDHVRGKIQKVDELNALRSMHVYDSIAVFEKLKIYNTRQFTSEKIMKKNTKGFIQN